MILIKLWNESLVNQLNGVATRLFKDEVKDAFDKPAEQRDARLKAAIWETQR